MGLRQRAAAGGDAGLHLLATAEDVAADPGLLDRAGARLGGLQANWRAASATQVYTVHDLHPFLGDEIIARAGNGAGLTWHYCRPPIEGLEYEMDVRRVSVERVI